MVDYVVPIIILIGAIGVIAVITVTRAVSNHRHEQEAISRRRSAEEEMDYLRERDTIRRRDNNTMLDIDNSADARVIAAEPIELAERFPITAIVRHDDGLKTIIAIVPDDDPANESITIVDSLGEVTTVPVGDVVLVARNATDYAHKVDLIAMGLKNAHGYCSVVDEAVAMINGPREAVAELNGEGTFDLTMTVTRTVRGVTARRSRLKDLRGADLLNTLNNSMMYLSDVGLDSDWRFNSRDDAVVTLKVTNPQA